RHPGKVTVFVPHYAMSGGTLIALAADEIVMDPDAVLGPVDPQLGPSAAASILSVLERKEPKDIDDQTLILADTARKALTQVRATVRALLGERMAAAPADTLADTLATGVWGTHDHPITADQAKALRLPLSTHMPTGGWERSSPAARAVTGPPSPMPRVSSAGPPRSSCPSTPIR